jgi:alpha-L-fucosidase 2
MKRYAQVIRPRPEKVAEYVALRRAVWPAVLERISACRRLAILLALAPLAAAQVKIGPMERPPGAGPDGINLDPPLSRPEDGIPLGNGALAVTVLGSGNRLRLALDRADLWDERLPEPATKPDWSYATLRRLVGEGDERRLREVFEAPFEASASPARVSAGSIELVFAATNAVRRFRFEPSRGEVIAGYGTARVLVHAASKLPLVLVRVDNDFPRLELAAPAAAAALGLAPAKSGGEGNLRWSTQALPDGSSFAVVVAEYRDDRGVTYSIAIPRASAGRDPVAAARGYVEISPTVTYDQIARTFNVPWWHEQWQASWIKLPDSRLQAQYDLARYLYLAGSRLDQLDAGGAPLAPGGPWTAAPAPLHGAYRHALETGQVYGAYAPMGFFDAGDALLRWLSNLEPRLRAFAGSFYGVEGLAAPGSMTPSGKPAGGPAPLALTPSASAWLAHLFHQHWRYGGDPEFLAQRAYPWCAAAGEAWLGLARSGDDGKLRLPLSSSPPPRGAPPRWLPSTSSYDLALATALFAGLHEMADALGEHEAAARWVDVLGRLELFEADPESGGLPLARGVAGDAPGSFAHALAIHPLGLVTVEGPEAERKLVHATLAAIAARGTSSWNGADHAWYAALCARAALGDQALDHLERSLVFTSRNGLHLEGDPAGGAPRPLALAGNMLFAQAVHELLLQGWGGTVRVFPAAPQRWKETQFKDLRAEGALRVSARREEGRTMWVSVTSDRGGQLRVRDPFPGEGARWSSERVVRDGADFVVQLEAGETVQGWREREPR